MDLPSRFERITIRLTIYRRLTPITTRHLPGSFPSGSQNRKEVVFWLRPVPTHRPFWVPKDRPLQSLPVNKGGDLFLKIIRPPAAKGKGKITGLPRLIANP